MVYMAMRNVGYWGTLKASDNICKSTEIPDKIRENMCVKKEPHQQ